MKQLSNITKALADQSRIRILAALEGQELCVCQITELLRLAPSTVSKHLFLLKHAGLIESRKAGRWMYYRLAGEEASSTIHRWLKALLTSASTEKCCIEDQKALKGILKMGTEKLCSEQRRRSCA